MVKTKQNKITSNRLLPSRMAFCSYSLLLFRECVLTRHSHLPLNNILWGHQGQEDSSLRSTTEWVDNKITQTWPFDFNLKHKGIHSFTNILMLSFMWVWIYWLEMYIVNHIPSSRITQHLQLLGLGSLKWNQTQNTSEAWGARTPSRHHDSSHCLWLFRSYLIGQPLKKTKTV